MAETSFYIQQGVVAQSNRTRVLERSKLKKKVSLKTVLQLAIKTTHWKKTNKTRIVPEVTHPQITVEPDLQHNYILSRR